MNNNQGYYQITNSLNSSLNMTNEIFSKNSKMLKPKINVKETQRGRNTRQFGTDITNLNTSITNNNLLQCHKPEKIELKKKPLSRKGSVSSRKVSKQQDLRTKKHIRGVPDLSVDYSAQNLKMEISNHKFGGSSMILDEPVMTRNQISEKLQNNDPQLVLEYLESILLWFYQTEADPKNVLFYPYYNYMRSVQKDINDKMRVILFDWLVDVHLKWKLLPDTLYLTFNIIDRFLGLKSTPRDELQCVGVAALLLACKYEEIYFPEISDFQEITDNAFSKQEILKKEFEILAYLKYDLTVPSSFRFFEVFNIYLKLEGKEKATVLFLIEMCCFDYSMIKYKPSLITTGVLMLMVSYNKSQKDLLFMISNYSNDQIALFCKDLIDVYYKLDHGSKALKRKFSSAKYYEVAKLDVIAELNARHNMSMNENMGSGLTLRSHC